MRRLLGLAVMLCAFPGSASAHPAGPPRPPVAPPQVVEEIPPEDVERYRSLVTRVAPSVPGLDARVVGAQEKLEVTWTGRAPLIVEGYRGEPMLRLSSSGVEVNSVSPSAYLSGDRYAAISVPPQADPAAAPRWRPLESAGPISWYDHRIHWMRAARPEIVGEGEEGATIFHWRVPMTLAGRPVSIRGGLDWVPDPAAIRAERSDADSPLLVAALLACFAAAGAGVGVVIRGRLPTASA